MHSETPLNKCRWISMWGEKVSALPCLRVQIKDIKYRRSFFEVPKQSWWMWTLHEGQTSVRSHCIAQYRCTSPTSMLFYTVLFSFKIQGTPTAAFLFKHEFLQSCVCLLSSPLFCSQILPVRIPLLQVSSSPKHIDFQSSLNPEKLLNKAASP